MQFFPSWSFKLRYGILSLIMVGILILAAGSGHLWAQELSPALGWKSFGIEGDLAYAPVRLDGAELFSIATSLTPTGEERSGVGALQVRRHRIENRLRSQLQYLIDNGIDPADLAVITTTLNQQTAVQVIIDGKPSRPIVTVTALDAEIYGLTEAELAAEFAQRIQAGLEQSMAERQPEALQRQIRQALVGGAIATLLIALLSQGERWLRRQRTQLRQQLANQQQALLQPQAPPSPTEAPSREASSSERQIFQLKRQTDHKAWQTRLVQFAMAGTVLVTLAWVLQRFPQTRPLGILLVKQPLGLLLLGLVVTLLILASRLLIDLGLAQWVGTEATISAPDLARRRRRGLTLSKIWHDVITALWGMVGIVLAAWLLTLSSGWTLTLQVGLLGVVVSLAFQSMIKDALAGTMLLSRDAYTIGDMVAVKEIVGVVEAIGLLMTQIRTSSGHLVTLRNGEITTVANYSRDWARMDFTVWVDHDTNLLQALSLMREVFQTMQTSPDWSTKLIDQPDILGVENIDPQGILLRIRTQTAPGQQLIIAREYRLRLNQAFRANGIKFALPQRELRYRDGRSLSYAPSTLENLDA